MAEKANNQPNITLPQRTITITGEYSARMCQNTVRVSRIEQRAIQIAMAPPAIRDAGRRAMDRFAQATSQFEAELAQIEKELDASSRNGTRRRDSNKPRREDERQTLSRNPAQKGGQQQGAPRQAQPKPRNGAAVEQQAKAEPGKSPEQTGKTTPQEPRKPQAAKSANDKGNGEVIKPTPSAGAPSGKPQDAPQAVAETQPPKESAPSADAAAAAATAPADLQSL